MFNRKKDVICSAKSILIRILVLLVFAIICVGVAKAQPPANTTATAGWTPMAQQPGAPAGSYPLSGFDNVNLFNGNLNFRIPLLHVGGRGSAGYTMTLPVEQHWRVQTVAVPTCNQSGCSYLESNYKYIANPNWWEGILPGYGPGVLQGRQSGDYTTTGTGCAGAGLYHNSLTRLTFTAGDGTEYELRDLQSGGQPGVGGPPPPGDPSGCFYGLTRGKVFVTADGSAATFVSDVDIFDWRQPNSNILYPSGYLLLKDGARYRIDSGRTTWIRDNNGNKVSFTYTGTGMGIDDSLDRHIDVTYGGASTPDVITFQGFNLPSPGPGTTRTIKVYHAMLDTVLRKHPDGSTEYSIRSFASLFPTLQNVQSGNFDITVPSAVELPDGRQYQFRYDSYANLAEVILPTGGRFEYDWNTGTYQFGDHVKGITNRVTERRTAVDTTTTSFATKMTYADTISGSYPNYTTDVTVDSVDPNNGNALLGRSIHHFYGSWLPDLSKVATDYPYWRDGREYETDEYAANGTTVLRRKNDTWQQRAAVSWWTGSADAAPSNDPRLVESLSTLVDTNQVSKQSAINPNDSSIGFDQYNNQTDVWEYDYGSGAAGSLVRHSHTNYLTSSYDTLNPSSSSPDLSLTYHIRSLPTQVSLYDASNNEEARSTTEYDNYATDSFHAGLVDRSNISGHDSGLTTSFTYRGNATATSKYLLPAGTAITSYAQYDIAGNLVKAIDPRSTSGNVIATTIAYDDNFGAPDASISERNTFTELGSFQTFAFPTQVTNALGQSGYTQYDYYLGRPVDQQDFNGVISSGYYIDLLDRPTQVIRAANLSGNPARSQISFAYDDTVNHKITTTTDLSSYGDNTLKSEGYYDGLGRTIEGRKYETSTAYIDTQQQYDAAGRVKRSYNPFRTTSDDTYGWTDSTYDSLGRVTAVQTFDKSGTSTGTVQTSYGGNQVMVTDQAGEQRRSFTDGLGHLNQVDEMYQYPSTSVYASTTYQYDILDDLTTVNQGSQTRTFNYDSLKRLTSAVNPESGTVSYTYDSGGNLSTKTDARSITTTMTYDPLNRPKTKSYSDSTQPVYYFYDSDTLPSGAPGFSRGYSVGRLVAVTYGKDGSNNPLSLGDYYGYDPLGKPLVRNQQMDNGLGGVQNYSIGATYNPGGMLLSETYPSGRTVTTTFDTAGRVSSLASNSTTMLSSISYAPQGGLLNETYGNGNYHSLHYNSRLQPDRISLGTNSTSFANVMDLQYGYGTTNNNGNIQNESIYVGTSVWTQTFTYDDLNRLTQAQETGPGSGSWAQTFSYDRYGNRTGATSNVTGVTTSAPTIDAATNRFVLSGTNFTYDSAGNLTHDNSHSYGFDAENHVTSLDGSNNQYVYDGEGKRIRKVPTDNLRMVYGIGGNLIAEYDHSSGALKKEYIHGVSGLVATVEPIAGAKYLTADHLGSPRVIMDSSGMPSRHDYLPFGEEIPAGVDGRTTGNGWGQFDGERQKFTSKERDTETGLDWFGTRFLNSSHGRFICPDKPFADQKISDPGSWNIYLYVRDNPLKYIDETGEEIKYASKEAQALLQKAVERGDKESGTFSSALDEFRGPNSPDIILSVGDLPGSKLGLTEVPIEAKTKPDGTVVDAKVVGPVKVTIDLRKIINNGYDLVNAVGHEVAGHAAPERKDPKKVSQGILDDKKHGNTKNEDAKEQTARKIESQIAKERREFKKQEEQKKKEKHP